jgi:ubiquinone/menaquinone biosynthesis C-methylase UbiE
MTSLTVDKLEQLRQHFNKAPYLNYPIEECPKTPDQLYVYDIATAFYRRDRRVIQPEGRVILDAGCGTGYKSLALALANPGAKIIGVDLSEDSVEMSKQRLRYHKIDRVEFHAMPLERIGELGMMFDYINCDEVLYLVPDSIAALKAMKSVLKPDGIIRVNYHSEYGRRLYRSSQEFFRTLGCMQGPPDESEIALVRQTMHALKQNVTIKGALWNQQHLESNESILANFLLQNDKTWSIKQFFSGMRDADLSFFDMVQWWEWDLMNLFDVDELPFEAVIQLSELSQEEQLALNESINWNRRLLDLWCGHPRPVGEILPIEDWSESDWLSATVHFHPQLRNESFKADLCDCAATGKMLDVSGHMRTTTMDPEVTSIDSLTSGCLLPLLDGGRRFQDLLNRWLHLRPINPITMEPAIPQEAFEPLHQLLMHLERVGYLMLEQA